MRDEFRLQGDRGSAVFDSQPPPKPEPYPGTDENPKGGSEDAADAEPDIQPRDIDAWFGERDRMIAALQQRRGALLQEIGTIAERLHILGVQQANEGDEAPREAARATKRRTPAKKAAAPPSPKVAASSGSEITSMDKILVEMRPGHAEQARIIAARLKLNYNAVWRALNTALKHGLVKKTGVGHGVLWTRIP